MLPLRLLLCLLAAAAPARAVRSFGRGYDGPVCLHKPVTVFAHTIPSDHHRLGVMDHFWTTGSSEEQQAAMDSQLWISYFFDGESTASIAFNPAQMAGQMFGAVQLGNSSVWTDGTRAATQNTSMYAAGDKMGKNALTSAWFNYYKLPFKRSVTITAQLVPRPEAATPKAGACGALYCVVRGHEAPASAPAIILPSGFALPPSARMELQHTDIVAAPNAFTALANVSAGKEGLLFQVTLGLTASPPWGIKRDGHLTTANNYVEGCWHLMRNSTETLPGQVLGTGLEDFFDSAYGFSIIAPGYAPPTGNADPARLYPGEGVNEVEGYPYQHPSSGILHFSSDYSQPKPVERFSGYRFFDAEMVGFDSGGQFGWDNGCAGYIKWPSINKCGEHPLPPPPPPPFPPPGPPGQVGCADGTCEAFCDKPNVRGCGASWSGAKSLRAPRAGNCSGALPKPHCETPADACATGWAPCLADGDRTHFMEDLSPKECGGSWGAWALAMSHAPLNRSNRQFCPNSTAAAADNTCRSSADSWGAEALCCGESCEVPTCQTALWPQQSGCAGGADGSPECGTLMVKAGSGVCDATVSTNIEGVMCCRKPGGEAAETVAASEGGRQREGACQTSPTRVRASVWMYTWPEQ